MKPIFHSLGSNYSLKFVTLALQQLFFPHLSTVEKLQDILAKKYHGEAFLFYKGRDAIEWCVKALGCDKDDVVLTQAFTCHAIEEAITRAGAQTGYVDLEKESLNPSVKTLSAALKKFPKAKAVIIQHTLGMPAPIAKIRKWCDEHKLMLIEDLAQSLGALDEEGVEVGSLADIVICSFGRDKVIDAVAGGAVIVKSTKSLEKVLERGKRFSPKNTPAKLIVWRDMLYPAFTFVIRRTHQYVIGKILFQILKRTGMLTSPIQSPTQQMTKMPEAYAVLALYQFNHLPGQLRHRRELAGHYAIQLKELVEKEKLKLFELKDAELPIYMRYPVQVESPDQVAKELRRSSIFLTDRWYRKAVDYGVLARQSVYEEGSCPNAEYLADHIFNLPTHGEITTGEIQRIVSQLQQQFPETENNEEENVLN